MISFKNIEKHSLFYDISNLYICNHVRKIFFSSFKVEGKENIPPKGTPTILISNHQNGLMDALVILSAMPRNSFGVFLARADIFKNDTLAKILRWLRIMPIFRQRDGAESLDRNDEVINKSAQLINDGYPIYIFPEGQHQEGHFLGNIKKGFARISFDAAEKNNYTEHMVILPMGHHYEDYFEDRAPMSVRFGKPIQLREYYELYRENPPKARLELAEKAAESLKKLIIDIHSPEYYEEIEFLRKVNQLQTHPTFEEEQKFVEKLIAENNRNTFLNAKLVKKQLFLLGLKVKDIIYPPTLSGLLGKSLGGLLALPLFLYGTLLFCIPWIICRKIASTITQKAKNKMLFSSFYYVLSTIILFPIFAIINISIVAILSKSWLWTLSFALSIIPCKVIWVELCKYYKSLGFSWKAFILRKKSYLQQVKLEKIKEQA